MEIKIRLDRRKKEAKALVEYLKSLSFVEIEKISDNPRYNVKTEKAINDAHIGKTMSIDLESFRKQLFS